MILFGLTTVAFAQNIREPNRDQSLNGLKILVFAEPTNPQLTVKLRIHSGAAFDPKDKTGVTRLLADAILPDEPTRQFFEEELNGKITIESNYDFIEITAQGGTDDFIRILDTLQTAVTNTNLTQENFVKLREARIKAINEDLQNPNYIADLAVRNRLYGDYPYGKPMNGNAETLAKIDRFDLLTARDKFVTADNATIAIIGNIKPTYANRAVRQLFGNWKKADKLVPATFRQPEPPKTEVLRSNQIVEKSQVNVAVNGFPRNDKNFFAAQIFIETLKAKTRKFNSIVHEPHLLRGILIATSLDYDESKFETPKNIFSESTLQTDFEKSKSKIIADFQTKTQSTSTLSEMWLDADTFRLAPIKEQLKNLNAVTLKDVNNVAETLNKQPVASVVLKAQN
ncbi:MAG: insulinase family protein [Pyrinomonadaceae bacterium]|nr:insulinase family protein [Pyrinomonadaceae bacterium]